MDGEGRLTERGFRVVPGALRQAQKVYDRTATRWDTLAEDLDGWRLEENDLGLLGRLAGVVTDYNAAVDGIEDKLRIGSRSLRDASDALNQVAAAYEAQDEKYYAKFGWTEKQMDGVAPAPR